MHLWFIIYMKHSGLIYFILLHAWVHCKMLYTVQCTFPLISGIKLPETLVILLYYNGKCTCKNKRYNNITSKHILPNITKILRCLFTSFSIAKCHNTNIRITFKIYTIYFVYFMKFALLSSYSTYGSFIEPLQSGTSVIAITLFCLTVVKQNIRKLLITFITKCLRMDVHPHDISNYVSK